MIIKILSTLVFCIPFLACAQMNYIGEKDLATVLIQFTDSSIHKGFLTDITEDYVEIFNPEHSIRGLEKYSISGISRLDIRKTTPFWQALKNSFLSSEASLLVSALLTESNDPEFNIEEYLLFGNLVFVLPASIVGGVSGITPKFHVDLQSGSDIKALRASKVMNYAAKSQPVFVSESGKKMLDQRTFPKSNNNRLSPNYAPKLYFLPVGIGLSKSSVAQYVERSYKSAFVHSYSNQERIPVMNFGFAYSPHHRWEFNYCINGNNHSIVSLESTTELAAYDFYQNTQTLSLLYRLISFRNVYGKEYQLAIGGGYALLSLLQKGILLNQPTSESSSLDKYERFNNLSGASLHINFDYFLSRNISLQASWSYHQFQKTEINAMTLASQGGISLPSIVFRPHVNVLSANLRLHI